jgi:Ca-activated chloride channel family protein
MISLLRNIEFATPEFLFLLLLIPVILLWTWWKKPVKHNYFTIPDLPDSAVFQSFRSRFLFLLPLLRIIAFSLLVLALARPQKSLKEEEVKAEGIDIMMVMDLSSSMLAQDFRPDRLSVSKRVAAEFVEKRKYDRIGLAVFAGESYTQCPLTVDHQVLKQFMSILDCGFLKDGTAIGMGLASAVNRLKDSESKSKVVILLTDGVNNAGYIKPMTAAEIAEELDVKVYTIGVGSIGQALSPISRRSDGKYMFGMAKVEIDEALLKKISEMTGGKYFRATNEASLQQIYAEIDSLEKTEIDVQVFKRYSEEFRRFLLLGLIFLGIELVLRFSLFKTLP